MESQMSMGTQYDGLWRRRVITMPTEEWSGPIQRVALLVFTVSWSCFLKFNWWSVTVNILDLFSWVSGTLVGRILYSSLGWISYGIDILSWGGKIIESLHAYTAGKIVRDIVTGWLRLWKNYKKRYTCVLQKSIPYLKKKSNPPIAIP